MRFRFLLPFLLFLTGCASTPELDYSSGPGVEETANPVELSGKTPVTLVWIVSPVRGADEIMSILKRTLGRNSRFRMSVALPSQAAASLFEQEKNKLLEWSAQGRLEIALLPEGNIPLPLLSRFSGTLQNSFGASRQTLRGAPERIIRPYDLSKLFVRASENWNTAFPESGISAFALPAGLPDEEALNACAASECAWILAAATGPASYLQYNGLDIYAAKPFMSGSPWAPGIYALDEHYGVSMDQAPSLLEEIAEDFRKHDLEAVPLTYWKTQASSAAAHEETAASFFPHWGSEKALSVLWDSEAQKRYWTAMARVYSDISSYQNSGRARIAELDRFWDQYYSLLSSSWTYWLREESRETPEAAAKDKEFHERLYSLYSDIQKVFRIAPPAFLKRPLWGTAGSTEEGTEAAGTPANFFEFEDTHDFLAGEGPDLKNFSISWSKTEFVFRLEAEGEPGEEAEIYIDLNSRPYEGQEKNLSGTLRAAPVDFWEYALRWDSSGKVALYRHQAGGVRLRREMPSAGERKEGIWTLRLPREWIPGKDPSGWGWAVCVNGAEKKTGEGVSRAMDCLQTYTAGPDALFFTRPSAHDQKQNNR